MIPERYTDQLKQLSDAGDADGLLALTERFGYLVDDALTNEDRDLEATLAHWAVMLISMRKAAPVEAAVTASN